MSQVNLAEASTLEAGLELIGAAAKRIPAPGWIFGGSWDHRRWGGWPTAAALERVAPGRLVLLRSFDHHAVWASHATLALAGIDRSTPDPEGGFILRTADGEPEGVLLENASELADRAVPPPDESRVATAVQALGLELLKLGVVGAHDPRFLAPDPQNRAFDMYERLANAGDLPFRVHVGVRSEGLADAIARGYRSGMALGDETGRAGGRLTMGWLKLFADGTLASRTAALLEPVEGTDNRGIFTTPPAEMQALVEQAAAGGIATKIHAIGDRAVRTALDILGPSASSVAFMPRLEHVQLCHLDDRARFGALGVAASVQPVHIREDAATARRDWGDRAEAHGYTWRSLLDAGAVVAFGTDAPVEPIDPWPGIAMAVLRRDPSWGPEA
ncbi:MAG: amidohydrolase family protein, partial [Chloroflexota bacterium]